MIELTEEQKQIMRGQRCPYCKKPSKLMDSKDIYSNGKSYGPVWACLLCQAWVGVHVGTTKALGRLANARLRRAKNAAHLAFDQIWRQRVLKRTAAYEWLSIQLGLPKEYTHIGMFSEATCARVVELCKEMMDIHRKFTKYDNGRYNPRRYK